MYLFITGMSGNPLSTTPEIGYARQPSEEPEDPLTFPATASSTVASGVQSTAWHTRYPSQSSEDPLTATDEAQASSGLEDMVAQLAITDDAETSASYYQQPGAEEVTTELKHGKVRFKDSNGRTYKTQTNEWQFYEGEYPYFLFTAEDGQLFWTWELGSGNPSSSHSSRRKDSNKGKHRK